MNVLYAARTAEYFAQVTDLPWIVKQERLDELQEQMAAGPSQDFNLETYTDPAGNVVKVGRLFSLPFRLSLGMHEASIPLLHSEATVAIRDTYLKMAPLHPQTGYLKAVQRQRRVDAAIGGALIEAASERVYADILPQRLSYLRKNQLISSTAKFSVKLVASLYNDL